MASASDISSHYSRGVLLERLESALRDDGVDPAHPTLEALAPYDQFHGRGMEVTEELAALVEVKASDHLLDVGSGIGGPARYFASRFGCRVTGIDLTAEFCDVARHLTRLMHLEDRVTIENGNALAMPFERDAFDGAYSMNVSMNIEDKRAFYREIRRVLKPGAWLVLSEIARGPGAEPDYPMPWAKTAATSFLATKEETTRTIAECGFEVVRVESTAEKAKAFGARSRAAVERGEKPPHRAVMVVHGELAREAMANSSRAIQEGRTEPIEVLARKRVRE